MFYIHCGGKFCVAYFLQKLYKSSVRHVVLIQSFIQTQSFGYCQVTRFSHLLTKLCHQWKSCIRS